VIRVEAVPYWSLTGSGSGRLDLKGMRGLKERMGPSHTKPGARRCDVKYKRAKILKPIRCNRLTGSEHL